MRYLPLPLLFLLTAPASAQDKGRPPEALARIVAPFVDDMTTIVVHADVARLKVEPFFKLLEDMGVKDRDFEKAQAFIGMARDAFLKAGGRDLFVVWNWDAVRPNEDFLLVIPAAEKGAAAEVADFLEKLPGMKVQVQGDVTLVSTARHLERLKSIKAKERPDLVKAFAAFAEDAGKAIILPAPIVVRGFVEAYPTLPPKLARMQTRELARSLQWAGLGLRSDPKLEATWRLQATDEMGAQAWLEVINAVLDLPLDHPETKLHFPHYPKVREKLAPKVLKDQLVLPLQEDFIKGVLVDAGKAAKAGAGRAQSVNNMKQLAIAFHSYHDSFKSFPPAFSTDAKGKALLSWRVHLLPYLDQEDLYKEFKLDEPWDSEHNKKLIDKMPALFRSPLLPDLARGKTVYLVPTGAKTIFEGNKGLHLLKIPDGTANTILLLEAAGKQAVFWTQPADFPINQKDLLAGLVQPEMKGFHAAFADGSVRWISSSVDQKSLRAALTVDDGMPLKLDPK